MDRPPEVHRMPRVGLYYDERMCLHATPDGEIHPENPERIKAIMKKLEAEGIPERCILIKAKEAEDAVIESVHSRNHIQLIKNISSKGFDFQRRIASSLDSIYFNEGSSEAAYLAAGSVIEASVKVANGDLDSAIAVVRPPGHHAEAKEAMGFCLFNNVAIAASHLLKAELGIKRILIVDWDVHHGNGTQNMFYDDPRILYFSVHRFDFGSFYPTGGDGSHCMIGEDEGAGYNINVPWEHGQCGDADYLAVWNHILIPVTEAYKPDIILISAGFDAAMGDPLGGCCLTPYGYSLMLKKLMNFADGKIILALEGGYNLNSLADSVYACAKTLLEGSPIVGSLEGRPFQSTWRVINEVRNELKTYWPALAIQLPQKIQISKTDPNQIQAEMINFSSDSDVEKDDEPSGTIDISNNYEAINIISPLSKLHLHDGDSEELQNPKALKINENEASNTIVPWRASLSKINVWYGSYGSNMWMPRFLCYINGGKVEGMTQPCRGAWDTSPPKGISWKTVPHRLFFGRSHSNTWGPGGVAFLNPQCSLNDISHICIHKITLEQFNDVLLQENATEDLESAFVDSHFVGLLSSGKCASFDSLKDGWYSNILYLGEEDGIPILTMTCPFSDVERFKSGELPFCAPSQAYENTLLKGLVDGKELSMHEAITYLKDSITKKL